jgi:ubiquinone/menaquinone biosynthesis C-methylase UbiE
MKQETLREIWRVLDDGGELIIMAAAWITGDKILDRVATWLFRVTGQAPTLEIYEIQDWYSREFEKIRDTKYLIETQLIELETSKVLLIHANKAIT